MAVACAIPEILQPARQGRDGQRRVAVIGGGLSGISAARHLLGEGIEPIIFEKRDRLGGLWIYSDDPNNGKMYASLCCNSNRQSMVFPDLDMPEDWPDYPRHSQILEYLTTYVKQHNLESHTAFRSSVVDITETPEGRWEVTYESVDGLYERSSVVVDGVVSATGQAARPFIPQVKGLESFRGQVMHSSQFRRGTAFQDHNVLIVGLGTATGPDIAQEISYSARHLSVSTRRGMTFLPR